MLVSNDITRIRVWLNIICFTLSSICVPARALFLPFFLNPPTLLLPPKYLPVTRKCLGTEEHGCAWSHRQQLALATLGGGRSRDQAVVRRGDSACFSMGCWHTDAEALSSTPASLFSSLPSAPPACSLHMVPQRCSCLHPSGRGHPGEDGKPGRICPAFRISRVGMLETIQFSRCCSQGHE